MERYNTSDASAKWNHEPDIDVTNMVHKNLHGIEAQFLHIKSHQDRQRKSETLSFPARLNIRADQLATDQQELMKQPETTVTTNFHHLVIENHFITRESQKWLLDYASRIPIQQYYHDKYGWSSKTFHSIDWDLQHKVLRRYGVNDQRRILKFVHGWLPTNNRLFREQRQQTQRCPLCHYIKEDAVHLFHCLHTRQMDTKHDLITRITQEIKIKEPIRSMITKAIEKSASDPTWQPEESHESRGAIDQSRIGWQQLFFGRIAKDLVREFECENVMPKNGQVANNNNGQKLIRLIWDTFLKFWTQRNEQVFGETAKSNKEAQRSAWIAKVERCFEQETMLEWKDRSKVFQKSKEEILTDEPHKIAAWVKLAERLIKINKHKKRKDQAQRGMMDKHFQWKPPKNRAGTHSTERKQHHKQNLKPD
jgi:hypothetical protein